jgi:hypothetical protein
MGAMNRPNLRVCSRREMVAYVEWLEQQLTQQLSLIPVRSRNTDPNTSRLAAFNVFPKTESRRHVLLHALNRVWPDGLTQDEAAIETGIVGVWKRLSELHQGGWAEIANVRIGRLSGAEQSVYAITDRGRAAIAAELAQPLA